MVKSAESHGTDNASYGNYNFFEARKNQAPADEVLKRVKLGTNFNEYTKHLADLKRHYKTDGVNNLARGENTVDIVTENTRFLAFPNQKEDEKIYKLLKDLDIPQLPRIRLKDNPEITIVNIPPGSWRLDSSDYPEQEPTFPEGSGAIEIMRKLGMLLNSIDRRTGLLPKDFKLCHAAFIPGNKDFIRLIPPYTLSSDVEPSEIIERVERDLELIDPKNPHKKQIEVFTNALFGIKK